MNHNRMVPFGFWTLKPLQPSEKSALHAHQFRNLINRDRYGRVSYYYHYQKTPVQSHCFPLINVQNTVPETSSGTQRLVKVSQISLFFSSFIKFSQISVKIAFVFPLRRDWGREKNRARNAETDRVLGMQISSWFLRGDPSALNLISFVSKWNGKWE